MCVLIGTVMERKNTFIFFILFYYVCCIRLENFVSAIVISPDFDPLATPRQISSFGYPFEKHKVITEDGYILEMYRIPHGKNNPNEAQKPVILLMHGLLGSSENFVISGPKRAIGFLLADKGYDVWIGNARGSRHSRKHVTLDPDRDKAFWQFSWHEIGVYDLPAKIDYILEKTGQNQIFYIGHSQGTTSFYVMASERPEYNQKIKLMISFAPVAFMTEIHPKSIFSLLIKNWPIVIQIVHLFNINELFPFNELLLRVDRQLCNESMNNETTNICVKVLFAIGGNDAEQLDRANLSKFLGTFPAGAAFLQGKHYVQLGISGYFRKYDFGTISNMAKYKRMTPPLYDLQQITAPVALYYAQNDFLTSVKDVEILASKLPNVVKKQLISYKQFNHFDFISAIDVIELLYQDVFKLMQKYI